MKIKKQQEKQEWKEFKKAKKIPKKILLSDNTEVRPQYVVNYLENLKEFQRRVDNSGINERFSYSVTPRTYELLKSLSENGLITSKDPLKPSFEKKKYWLELMKLLEKDRTKSSPDVIHTIPLELNVKITEKGEEYIFSIKEKNKIWWKKVTIIFAIITFIMTIITTICSVVSLFL